MLIVTAYIELSFTPDPIDAIFEGRRTPADVRDYAVIRTKPDFVTGDGDDHCGLYVAFHLKTKNPDDAEDFFEEMEDLETWEVVSIEPFDGDARDFKAYCAELELRDEEDEGISDDTEEESE